MKFSPIALSSLSLVFGLTEAHQKMDASHLRKLYGNAADDFVLSGNSNFKFNSCVAVESDEDGDGDYDDAKKIEQYIVVDMIGADGQASYEYAVNIGTFVSSMGNMVAEQVDSYCEVCNEAADYCQNSYSQQSNNQASTYYDANEGKTVELIDCNTCALYNCYGENSNERKLEDGEVDMESALEYVEQVGQCQKFHSSYSNNEYKNDYDEENQKNDATYIGYVCTEDGTGVDLGFFYDGDCTVYIQEKSVDEMIAENSESLAMQYLSATKSLFEGVFAIQHSCSNLGFASPFDGQTQTGTSSAQSYYNGEYQYPAANEACTQTFESEDSTALGLCDGYDEDTAQLCEALAARAANQAYYQYGNQDCSMAWLGGLFCNQNDEQQEYGDENQNANVYDYSAWTDKHSPSKSKGMDALSSTGGLTAMIVVASVAAVALSVFLIRRRKMDDEASPASSSLLDDEASPASSSLLGPVVGALQNIFAKTKMNDASDDASVEKNNHAVMA